MDSSVELIKISAMFYLEIDPVRAKKSRVTYNVTRISLLGYKSPIQL